MREEDKWHDDTYIMMTLLMGMCAAWGKDADRAPSRCFSAFLSPCHDAGVYASLPLPSLSIFSFHRVPYLSFSFPAFPGSVCVQ